MMDDEAIIRKREIPRVRNCSGLMRYARNETSQDGEDGIIERIFELLPRKNSNAAPHFCVDIGAWDGKHLSNTFTLLVRQGWRGLLIEADPERYRALERLHEPLGNQCLNVAVSCQTGSPYHVVKLLENAQIPSDFDLLAIDVDGIDYWLLHDIFKRGYRPRVVCIEFNPSMPNDLIYIPPRSDAIRHGASLAALVELMETFQHELVETTIFNAFFVPKDAYQTHLKNEVPNNSIEALHEVTMGTQIYQLYDGTLKLHGCKKLLWHRVAIDEKKLQMMAPEKRQFPFAPQPLSAFQQAAVDISPYCPERMGGVEEHLDISRRIARESLWNQLKANGFCYIRGTGISPQLCRDALRWTRTFLQDADEKVRRSCRSTQDRARRGYSPMCTENFASLVGEAGPNDLVRKFRIGKLAGQGESSLLSPNVWPSTGEWDGAAEFRSTIEAYYRASNEAAQAVVHAIHDGVLDESPELESSMKVFGKRNGKRCNGDGDGDGDGDDMEHHSSILTLLSYRVGTRHKRKPRSPLVAPHTDVGVVTMLLFDTGGCAVLQRAAGSTDDSWVDVHLPEKVEEDVIFVINIADCLSILSNGLLPSTRHRVMPTSQTTARDCLAMFVGLEPSANLTLPSGENLTYEEWRRRRIAESQAVLKDHDDHDGASRTVF